MKSTKESFDSMFSKGHNPIVGIAIAWLSVCLLAFIYCLFMMDTSAEFAHQRLAGIVGSGIGAGLFIALLFYVKKR